METELKALQKTREEIGKIYLRYTVKAEKDRDKANDTYVMVEGEKCHTEQDILDWYAADYISSSQCDRYIKALSKKKEAKAGWKNGLTESERICNLLKETLFEYDLRIFDLKKQIKEEKEKGERLKAAQEQGLSYKQWMDLEEVNRQSADFEKLMGL